MFHCNYNDILTNGENLLDGEMSAPAQVIEEIEELKVPDDNVLPNNELSETPVYNTRALDKYASTYKLETFEKNYLAIFNQENVDGFKPRVGTEKDVEALDRTFSKFGFEVHEHKDLTKDEIMDELKVSPAQVIEEIEELKVPDDNVLPNNELSETPVYNTRDDETRALDKYASTYKLETFEKNYLAIFNQVNVDGFKPRVGTEKDVEALDRTFSKFGFEVHEHKDLTKDEIMDELKVFSEKDFTDYGCIAIAVLTHGTHGGLLRAKDMQYSETEIIKHFKAVKNPTLITKPKILIIQACRGTKSIKGLMAKLPVRVHKDVDEHDESYTLPIESDILVLHSSYPGNPSHRVNLFGSWYIQILCAEINKSYQKLDLESILTDVKMKMAIDMRDDVYNRRTEEWDINKQMPVVMSTLIRKLYLRKYGDNSTCTDNRVESEVEMPPSPMSVRFEPCMCYLDHFEYLKKCLRHIVDHNSEDKIAQSYLDICDTFRDGRQFNNSKEKMAQVISDHLASTYVQFEYFKYLYISPSTSVEEKHSE